MPSSSSNSPSPQLTPTIGPGWRTKDSTLQPRPTPIVNFWIIIELTILCVIVLSTWDVLEAATKSTEHWSLKGVTVHPLLQDAIDWVPKLAAKGEIPHILLALTILRLWTLSSVILGKHSTTLWPILFMGAVHFLFLSQLTVSVLFDALAFWMAPPQFRTPSFTRPLSVAWQTFKNGAPLDAIAIMMYGQDAENPRQGEFPLNGYAIYRDDLVAVLMFGLMFLEGYSLYKKHAQLIDHHHNAKWAKLAKAIANGDLGLTPAEPKAKRLYTTAKLHKFYWDDRSVRSSGESWYTDHRGRHIYTQHWIPSGNSPKGVVVVLHGRGDYSARFGPFAKKANAQGLAVYAIDMPGHGHSMYVRGQHGHVEDFDELALTVYSYCVHIRTKIWPEQPLHILGASMGGLVGTLTAIADSMHGKGLIDSLALAVPSFGAGSSISTIEKIAARFMADHAPTTGIARLTKDDFSRAEDNVANFEVDNMKHKGKLSGRTGGEFLRAWDKAHQHVKHLRLPLFAMHGTLDVTVDAEATKAFFAKTSTPAEKKTVEVFPKAMHDILHEPEREVIQETFIAWLVEQSDSGSSGKKKKTQ